MLKMRKISFLKAFLLVSAAVGFAACSNDEPNGGSGGNDPDPVIPPVSTGLFVVNEGGFGSSNGSLSFYDTEKSTIENDIFRKANGFGPGDVVQSMTISEHNPNAWLVVNNSQVIFAIDPETYKEKGRIAGDLVSPRQIKFISPEKAYVTQFYTNTIAVVNPATYSITKQITYPVAEGATPSTGEMVDVDGFMYVCCPNYNSAVLKINTSSDEVVDVIYPGIQPSFIVADMNRDLWILCNGGYQGSPYGYEAPKLVKVSTADFKVKAEYEMTLGDYVSVLAIDGQGENLFWINSDVYTMDINAKTLPVNPIIRNNGAFFYGLTIDNANGDIYVTDAVDFTQPGRLIRYGHQGGEPLSTVTTGICPHAFCWK